jgi:HD-like signal output (HDOD) protein
MIKALVMVEAQAQEMRVQHSLSALPVQIIRSRPSYANYVKTLQYAPDVIIIEIPPGNTAQMHYIQMIKQHKQMKLIPLICFGGAFPEPVLTGMRKIGIDHYVNEDAIEQSLSPMLKPLLSLAERGQAASKKRAAAAQKAYDRLVSPQVSAAEKIGLMAEHVSSLMAFPFTVARVLQLSSSETASVADLAKIAESDPVLSAAILRQCNSVFYAASTRRISSIREAIARIGFAETRRLAMTIAVIDLFKGTIGEVGFNRMAFWYHCLSAAIISQMLASRLRLNADEAFVAGLLHDFGIILLDEFFPELFSEILRRSTNAAASFDETEQSLIGISNRDVVRILFEKWKLPESVVAAATSSPDTLRRRESVSSDADRYSLCASVAANLANAFALGAGVDQVAPLLPAWATSLLKLDFMNANSELIGRVMQELNSYRNLLAMAEKTPVEALSGPLEGRLRIAIADCGKRGYVPLASYLSVLGHELELIDIQAGPESLAAGNEHFDLIVVIPGSSTMDEHINRALMLAPRGIAQGGRPRNSCGTMPVLALLPAGFNRASLQSLDRAALVMEDMTDLREFEHQVLRMLSTPFREEHEPVKQDQPASDANAQALPLRRNALKNRIEQLRNECREKCPNDTEFLRACQLFLVAQKIETGKPDESFSLMQLIAAQLASALCRSEVAASESRVRNFQKNIDISKYL